MAESVYKILGVRRSELQQVFLLLINLFLILTTYYIVKSIRGALVIQNLGADALPHLWILSIFSFTAFVSIYGLLIDRFARHWVVSLTSVFFIFSLISIFHLVQLGLPWASGLFYIWGEMFSVIMVEQFWSFTNDVFRRKQAKRLFAIIGMGGLLGGFSGGAIVQWITPIFGTKPLVFVCVGLILTIIISSIFISKKTPSEALVNATKGPQENSLGLMRAFELVRKSRYLLLICISVVLTQFVSTSIDFQFNKMVELSFVTLNGKSAFFGKFYMWLNAVSLLAMLFLAMPLNRYVGALAGLLILPLVHFLGFAVLIAAPVPLIFFAIKLLDKSLIYSVNRVSKELLYTPTSREEKFKAKAAIDMLGNRSSKVIAAALIILVSSSVSFKFLNIANLIFVSALVLTLFEINRLRKGLVSEPEAAPEAASSLAIPETGTSLA